MSDPNDENLIERLRAADPVDQQLLPSADDPTARQLQEQIMSTDSPSRPSADSTSAAPGPAEVLDLPAVPGIDRYAKATRRRTPYLAAVAAAILLVVGFVVFSPSNSTPALAAVHSAAQATADADSGRVTTTFDVVGSDGTSSGAIAGEVRATYSGSDVAVEVDVTAAEGEAAGFVPPASEGRLIDGVLYTTDGSTWYAVETGDFIGRSVVDLIDPRAVLAEVERLVDTTEVGSADVDGIATTQYRSVVDLGDESLRESGWLPVDAADLRAEGELTVDLFVDGDGLLRRLDLSADVAEEDGPGSAMLSSSTTFSDLGADITIEVPADAVPVDPSAELELDDLELGD